MLLYLIKASLVWGVFAVFYKMLLQKETYFAGNRIYLITTVISGLLLPMIDRFLSQFQTDHTPTIIALPTITIGAQQINEIEKTILFSYWWLVAGVIYFTGVLITATRFLYGLYQLNQLKRKSVRQILPNNLYIFQTDLPHLPFSFFNSIFVGTAGESEDSVEYQQMLIHEQAHVQGKHSWDVIFFELLCIVFWFHPLVYWYKNSIRAVHEFLADAYTANRTNRKQYGLLLIQQAQPGYSLAIANHFISSQLKKRIVMLTKQSSSPSHAFWKFGLTMPLLLLLSLIFQQVDLMGQKSNLDTHTQRMQSLKDNNWIEKDTIITFNPETFEENIKVVEGNFSPNMAPNGELIYQLADKLPEFPGGIPALMQFLGENIKYPEVARNAKAHGKVILRFIVDKNGKVDEVVEKGFTDGFRHQTLIDEAMRVVLSMPRWNPAEHDGKAVACEYFLPIMFRLE